MADQNKKIQRILVGDKEYEINAKYWGGLETGSKQDNITKMANEIGYQHLQTSHKYTDFEKCKQVLNKHRPDLYQILEKYFGDN